MNLIIILLVILLLLNRIKKGGYYGNINERQFRNVYLKAIKKKGNTMRLTEYINWMTRMDIGISLLVINLMKTALAGSQNRQPTAQFAGVQEAALI